MCYISAKFLTWPDESDGPKTRRGDSCQWVNIDPSGDRFLVVQPADDPASSQIHVIVNWTEVLKETMPVR